MSLDTVLQIGKALRTSKDNLKYFRYVNQCPHKNGVWPTCITIPIKADFSFDWDNVAPTLENQREYLYYLEFKTSDSDGMVKYIFGDIYYERKDTVKNGSVESDEKGGFYRIANPSHKKAAYRPSSFRRGHGDYASIVAAPKRGEVIKKFHKTLDDNLPVVERILEYAPTIIDFIKSGTSTKLIELLHDKERLHRETLAKSYQTEIFIHFEFPDGKHWYQFVEDLELITKKMLTDFAVDTGNGLVLKKTLYKALCSGDDRSDIQFPSFKIENRHKSKRFNDDELQDLFYAVDYTDKGYPIPGTDMIKLIVLPKGENLKAEDYIAFTSKMDEDRVVAANQDDTQGISGSVLLDFFADSDTNITSFDLIFRKKEGKQPDRDLIEISCLEKSKLRSIKERIDRIADEIKKERDVVMKKERDVFIKTKRGLIPLNKCPLKLEYSFRNTIGKYSANEPNLNAQPNVLIIVAKNDTLVVKPNPKYQSHLLRVLPLIYTENYYTDDVLLTAFIQNVEFCVRSGISSMYNLLKYDLKFLLSMQNSENNRFMELTNSRSYQIGLGLGKMAKPLRKKINPFEKRYVGLLTRHVSTKDDCIKFANEINEMLVRHEKVWRDKSADVCKQIVNIPPGEYDKEKLSLGFFEGYFTYEVAGTLKELVSSLKNTISKYEGLDSSEVENAIEELNNTIAAIDNTIAETNKTN